MMSNEDIIRILGALSNWQGNLSLMDKERVAIVTAMEAMKRQDKDVVPTEFHEKCMSKQLRRVAELEKQLKTLERPHGEWVWNTDNHNQRRYCKCSICGVGVGDTEYDFCPNCGADMRKEGDEK